MNVVFMFIPILSVPKFAVTKYCYFIFFNGKVRFTENRSVIFSIPNTLRP